MTSNQAQITSHVLLVKTTAKKTKLLMTNSKLATQQSKEPTSYLHLSALNRTTLYHHCLL